MAMMLSCRFLLLLQRPPHCPPCLQPGLIRCRTSEGSGSCRCDDAARTVTQMDWGGRPARVNIARWALPLCLAFLLAKEGQQQCHALTSAARVDNEAVAPSRVFSRYEPLSRREKEASISFTTRVDEAISWLEKGKQAQAQGDFRGALLWYTQIIEKDADLALAEYARVGRAISLYEVGDKEAAFVEMEDVSLSLKGYPEVHAALAATLYADKRSPVSAEQQFTIATLLDPHYTDLSYVKDTKHWPPSLVRSLGRFINLQ